MAIFTIKTILGAVTVCNCFDGTQTVNGNAIAKRLARQWILEHSNAWAR